MMASCVLLQRASLVAMSHLSLTARKHCQISFVMVAVIDLFQRGQLVKEQFLKYSSNGSSKTPCSCPGSIPNGEFLAKKAESESSEPESRAKDFAYACKQTQDVLFWKILNCC